MKNFNGAWRRLKVYFGAERNAFPLPGRSMVGEHLVEKYQQLLQNGKTGTAQVVSLRQSRNQKVGANKQAALRFKMITPQGLCVFTTAAVIHDDRPPATNSVVPIFYNPDDLSMVVLL
ncbi:MAG: hypothetical protein Q7T76_20450 [Ferruginibacter sp.]|nr:hypothetical protein [Ferruginibacter sp.]